MGLVPQVLPAHSRLSDERVLDLLEENRQVKLAQSLVRVADFCRKVVGLIQANFFSLPQKSACPPSPRDTGSLVRKREQGGRVRPEKAGE